MDVLMNIFEQAIHQEKDEIHENGWHLKRIYGGMNGIIYRADNSTASSPIAIKMRKRGERYRALREFNALKLLDDLSIPIAPKPIALYPDRPLLEGDVVISNWVEGDVLHNLSDAPFHLWENILTTFSKFHAIQHTNHHPILESVSQTRSTENVLIDIEARYAQLPEGQWGQITKNDIRNIIDEYKKNRPPNLPPATYISLITCDANPNNMIYHHGNITLIDWENSGWGDPASDIADLLIRPNCATLPDDMKQKIIRRYAQMMNLPELEARIIAYEYPMLIVWLILSSRGFGNTLSNRFKGIRTFTLEQTLKQQADYLHRIERVKNR